MEVSFAGHQLKLDSAGDAQVIVDKIRECGNLQALRLEGNTLGLEAAKVIADALKDKKDFEKALWSDIFTGRLRSEIPPSLKHLGDGIIMAGAKLSILDLSDNAFGPDGVLGIKKLLMSESCYLLHTLKLNNNGLGIGGGKILAEAFIECYSLSSEAGTPFALKVFISGRNRLENDGAKALSKAFKILGSLEEITMPQNGIRPEGVALLAEAFQQNKNLKIININDNTCTSSGAKALANCIHHLPKLETLNIGDCLLRDKGATILAPALAATPSLKEVIMSFNEILRDGAIAVASSMKNKDTIELLNLDGNQLGDSVDEIQDLMTELGKIHVLAPFDENEEPDSDPEDDDNDADGVAEAEQKPDDGEADDLSLHIKGMGLSKDSPLLADTVKTNGIHTESRSIDSMRSFIQTPSHELWSTYSPSERSQLLHAVVMEDLLPSAEKVSRIFVQTCASMNNEVEDISEISDIILGTAFNDDRMNAEQLVSNLLIHMGLLKAETKVEKVSGLKGPLAGIESIILKDYFPRNIASYFIAFLLKPNNVLEGCSTERHRVLQKLHQI